MGRGQGLAIRPHTENKDPKDAPNIILEDDSNTNNLLSLNRYFDDWETARKRVRLLMKHDNTCFWCNRKINTRRLTTGCAYPDLLLSNSKGGTNLIHNQVLACSHCIAKRYSSETNSDVYSWAVTRPDFQNLEMFKRKLEYSMKFARREQTRDILPKNIRGNSMRTSTRNVLKNYYIENRIPCCCCWCGKRLTKNTINLDHIIPRSEGGSHWIKNILPTCEKCNHTRGDMPVEDFAKISKSPDRPFLEKRIRSLGDPRFKQSYWDEKDLESAGKKSKAGAHTVSPYLEF